MTTRSTARRSSQCAGSIWPRWRGQGSRSRTWTAISGSLDALTFSLDDVSTAALSKLSAVNTAHKLGFFTGGNLEATPDHRREKRRFDRLTGRRLFVRGLRPITDAASVYGSVARRETLEGRRLLQRGDAGERDRRVPAAGVHPLRPRPHPHSGRHQLELRERRRARRGGRGRAMIIENSASS